MAGLLQRLAHAESPSLAPQAQAGALAILTGELESLGFEVERVLGGDHGDHLQAQAAGASDGAPRQLLLGHLDTVWPVGTVERMPVKLEDGRLSGPGVYDMKGGLVQMLFALRASDADDSDVIHASPLLAYLAPGRFASIGASLSFPFHVDSRR